MADEGEKGWLVNQLVLDSRQLLHRYKKMYDYLDQSQTGRSKSFVDLLMAYECILKAVLINFDECDEMSKLHQKIKDDYRHNVNKMVRNLSEEVPENLKNRHPNELNKIYCKVKFLNVDLRYSIESYWLRDAHEDLFYNTVSNHSWMEEFHLLVKDYIEWFDSKRNEDCINSGACFSTYDEMSEEDLSKIPYNPYRK